MPSILSRGATAASVLVALSAPALAHAVLERREAQANAPYRGVVQIGHGCKGSPTISVTVAIPEGAVGARPMPKPGWTLSTARGPYRRSYNTGHGSVQEGVQRITWSGGSLPDDHFDEFVFSVRLTDAFSPGETVYFPVEQTCAAGSRSWSQIPAAGKPAPPSPAPGVRIVAAVATAASPDPAVAKAGDLTIERPWMRATPGGAKVAGGYVRITNGGSVPDRLVASSIPLALRAEVHEMSNDGGVMKMRPVEGGLEIGPGATVELRPGGYHLMFMDLTAPVKAGEAVRGTLTFARAGTVEVTFSVSPIGAPGPSSDHSHD